MGGEIVAFGLLILGCNWDTIGMQLPVLDRRMGLRLWEHRFHFGFPTYSSDGLIRRLARGKSDGRISCGRPLRHS